MKHLLLILLVLCGRLSAEGFGGSPNKVVIIDPAGNSGSAAATGKMGSVDNLGNNVYGSTSQNGGTAVAPYIIPFDRIVCGAISATQSATAATITNCALSIDTSGGMQSVIVQTTNWGTATLNSQGTIDGTNWFTVMLTGATSSSAGLVSSVTSSTVYSCAVGGLKKFRVYCSAYTSGSNNVYISSSIAAPVLRSTLISGTSGNGTIGASASISDGNAITSNVALNTLGFALWFNGATYDRARIPSGNSTGLRPSVAVSTAAATSIWIPTITKKFRLMQLDIYIPNGATSATADNVMTFFDGATTITTVPITLSPTASVTNGNTRIVVPFGNGWLSSATNMTMTATMTANLTSSGAAVIYVKPMGTEE